jgi:predicted nucleotidyltransferase
MRLNETEQDVIKAAAHECFGPETSVRLFGSRVRQERRGGDIDLLVKTPLSDAAQISRAHTRFLAKLYERLGEQKIDVLIDHPGRATRPPIYDIAQRDGVML